MKTDETTGLCRHVGIPLIAVFGAYLSHPRVGGAESL
jgi:hypothetical protein